MKTNVLIFLILFDCKKDVFNFKEANYNILQRLLKLILSYINLIEERNKWSKLVCTKH